MTNVSLCYRPATAPPQTVGIPQQAAEEQQNSAPYLQLAAERRERGARAANKHPPAKNLNYSGSAGFQDSSFLDGEAGALETGDIVEIKIRDSQCGLEPDESIDYWLEQEGLNRFVVPGALAATGVDLAVGRRCAWCTHSYEVRVVLLLMRSWRCMMRTTCMGIAEIRGRSVIVQAGR